MTMAEHKRPTQCERIIRYIKDFGSITTRDAINDLGVYRLASRVSELKQDGYPIASKMEAVQNRYGETSYIKRYSFDDTKESMNDEN